MTGDEYVKIVLATVAWRVAGNHGVNAVCGVMFAIRNRVTAGWESGNWTKVMEKIGVFLEYPDPRNPEFQKVLQLVDGIYEGTTPDNLTDGAFYWDGSLLVRVDAPYERCAIIGTMNFYK